MAICDENGGESDEGLPPMMISLKREVMSYMRSPDADLTQWSEHERSLLGLTCHRVFHDICKLPTDTLSSLDTWIETTDIQPMNAYNIVADECVYILERYQEINDVSFEGEFNISKDILILSVLYGLWEDKTVPTDLTSEGNNINIDFTPLCFHLDIDILLYNMAKSELRGNREEISVNSLATNLLATPVALAVVLSMLYRELNSHRMKIDWHHTVANKIDIRNNDKLLDVFNDLTANINSVDDDALSQEQLGNEVDETEEISVIDRNQVAGESEVNEFFKDTDLGIKLTTEKNTLENVLGIICSDDRNPSIDSLKTMEDIVKNGEDRSEPMSEEERRTLESETEELKKQLEELTRRFEYTRKLLELPVSTLKERLNLVANQLVMAREADYAIFREARVFQKIDDTHYEIRFIEKFSPEEGEEVGKSYVLHVKDIADTLVHMYDEEVKATRYGGLRVIACVPSGDDFRWSSGTLGYAPNAVHNYDFLVFFDDGTENYVSGISEDNMDTFNASQIPEDSLENIRRKFRLLKIFPLCEQLFISNSMTEIDRCRVYTLVKDPLQQNFLREFNKNFPDCAMLRMKKPQPGYPAQMIQIRDMNKVVDSFVVQVDRHLCCLRRAESARMPGGAKCFEYPCPHKDHTHRDEWVFRGSFRFAQTRAQAHLMADNINTNLSSRRIGRNAQMFDNVAVIAGTNSKGTARKSCGGLELSERRNGRWIRSTMSGINATSHRKTASKDTKQYKVQLYSEPDARQITFPSYHAPEFCNASCSGTWSCTDDFDDLKRMSPLMMPIMCFWQRSTYVMKKGKRRDSRRKPKSIVVYRAPCGQEFKTHDQVAHFLSFTESHLTVDMFNFDPEINPARYITVLGQYIKSADYSGGVEKVPIPVVNAIDNEDPPKINYRTERFPLNDRVDVNSIDKGFCSGCTCTDDCSDPTRCECTLLTRSNFMRLDKSFRPEQHGYRNRILLQKTLSGIFECNEHCKCSRRKCHNRLVQNPSQYPLQLFKTAECGWGVRTVCDIPKGAFIANYVGALMSDEIADQACDQDTRYFADIDLSDVVESAKLGAAVEYANLEWGEKDEDDNDSPPADKDFSGNDSSASSDSEGVVPKKKSKRKGLRNKRENNNRSPPQKQEVFKWEQYFGDKHALYVLDARAEGNIGRYLNHSCEPNVEVQNVLVDTHDLRLPWLSFFANRNIEAGEELCWDYNYESRNNPDLPIDEQVPCHCGAENCCGRFM